MLFQANIETAKYKQYKLVSPQVFIIKLKILRNKEVGCGWRPPDTIAISIILALSFLKVTKNRFEVRASNKKFPVF